MKIRSFFTSLSLLAPAGVVLLLALSASAQLPAVIQVADTSKTAADANKVSPELLQSATQMIQQVGYEAGGLKLPENRAYVYATVGDILWKADEKQARKLFRDAASEIVNANNVPRKQDDPSGGFMPDFGRPEITNLRRMVLFTLASHDGEMALELMNFTRPADLAAAMQNYVAPAQPAPGQPGQAAQGGRLQPVSPTDLANNIKVQQEIQLEQSIIRKVSEQDPEQAAKLIRDALAKGFSFELMTLLQQIAAKDPKLANSVLAETVQKMTSYDYTNRMNDLMVAAGFLRTFALAPQTTSSTQGRTPSPLKLDPSLARDLANRLADFVMRSDTNVGVLTSLMPIFERLVPDRVAQLRLRQNAGRRPTAGNSVASVVSGSGSGSGTGAVRVGGPMGVPASLSDPNATPEALIADAANVNPGMRRSMYETAINKSLAAGDTDRIRSLLQNAPDGKERDAAIDTLNSRLAMKALAAGKLDDARRIVDQMQPGNAKIEQLVNIAVAARKVNTKESKDLSVQLMEQAKQMVSDFPEDKDEMAGAMKIISGYVAIDPDRAFQLIPGLIDEANQVIDAYAVLAKYNKQDGVFRDGEMLMSSGGSGAQVFRYGSDIKSLAQVDFARTMMLINQFHRDDIRLFVRLFVAQGILKDKIGLDGGVTY